MALRSIRILLFFIAAQTFALTPAEFAYRADIKTQSDATWYQVLLPMSVQFAAQSSDLRDVRIFNADGEALPFSIVRASAQSQRDTQSHPVKIFPLRAPYSQPNALPMIHVRETTAGTAIDISTPAPQNKEQPLLRGWLLDTHGTEGRFASLRLTWQGDVEGFQRFSIEASDDLQNWRAVGVGQIGNLTFNGETIVQRDVTLSCAATKYLRLLWLDPIQSIELSDVQLSSVNTTTQAAPMVWSNVLQSTRSDGGDTYFQLPGTVPIERIRFENLAKNTLAPLQLWGRQNENTVWFQVGNGVVYRLPAGSGETQSSEINLAGINLREIKLHIDQRGTGISQPQIAVGATANKIVFLARGKPPYTLAVGNKTLLPAELPIGVLIPGTAPSALLDNSNPAISAAEIADKLIAQQPSINASAVVKNSDVKRNALWAVLLIGVALLATMAWQTLRKPVEK